MNILLLILLALATLIALLLIIAIFIPKQYTVEVSNTIQKPKEEVFRYLLLLQNQLQYSEWLKVDETLKPTLLGEDGTEGTILAWKSNNPDKNKNVGEGELEIKVIDRNAIDHELRLIKPMAGVCQLKNILVEKGIHETMYTCIFSAYAKYPINLPSYVIGRKIIRKTQQKTIDNVKAILENSAVVNS
jgi:hypothetical protein